MRHPLREFYEKLGLVKTPGEIADQYHEADKTIRDAKRLARLARARRRLLQIELESYAYRRDE